MAHEYNATTARLLAVRSSILGTENGRGSEGVLNCLHRLGSVQIDTISVVERAHNHTLGSRVTSYRPSHLALLEQPPMRIIEYWSHAAAYLPIEEYRFCLPRMERVKNEGHEWFRAESNAIAYVRDRIRSEGPLRARDFEAKFASPRGWWDWKPAKIALEYLFHSGEFISIGRKNFQKVYDLAERHLPANLDLSIPTAREMARHHLDHAISALGIFTRDEIGYMRKDGLKEMNTELSARIEAKNLIELQLSYSDENYISPKALTSAMPAEPNKNKIYYANPEILESVRLKMRCSRAFILSPFDPLVIDRRRLYRLFGIDYRIECYIPEAKRRFGYFPLLCLYVAADGLVCFPALLDARANRAMGKLDIKRLALGSIEGRQALSKRSSIARALVEEIKRFATRNGTAQIELEKLDCYDGAFEKEFRRLLKTVSKGPADAEIDSGIR